MNILKNIEELHQQFVHEKRKATLNDKINHQLFELIKQEDKKRLESNRNNLKQYSRKIRRAPWWRKWLVCSPTIRHYITYEQLEHLWPFGNGDLTNRLGNLESSGLIRMAAVYGGAYDIEYKETVIEMAPNID